MFVAPEYISFFVNQNNMLIQPFRLSFTTPDVTKQDFFFFSFLMFPDKADVIFRTKQEILQE